jgi:hypothetical protein
MCPNVTTPVTIPLNRRWRAVNMGEHRCCSPRRAWFGLTGRLAHLLQIFGTVPHTETMYRGRLFVRGFTFAGFSHRLAVCPSVALLIFQCIALNSQHIFWVRVLGLSNLIKSVIFTWAQALDVQSNSSCEGALFACCGLTVITINDFSGPPAENIVTAAENCSHRPKCLGLMWSSQSQRISKLQGQAIAAGSPALPGSTWFPLAARVVSAIPSDW